MRDGWTETTLGNISNFVSTRLSPEDIDVSVPYVGLEHVDPHTPAITRWGSVVSVSSSVTPFEPGDVLFGRLRPYLHKVAFAEFSGVCSPEVLVLRAAASSIDGYLYLLCSTETTVKKCVDMSAGTRMPRTSTTDLASISVELPPLAEQNRIVDVVSSVDAYIDALQQEVDTARTTRNAVLHELLSAGGDDWTETTLGKTLDIARGGSPRPIKDFITSEEDGVNWVKIGDASASSKYIYRTEQKIRPEGISRSRQVKVGDFILSNSMSFGRPYIMRTDGCIHDGWLLLSKVEKYFDEDFLYNLLMSDLVQKQFDSLAAGSGVRNLNIEVAKEVVIPLPPLKVQREIAEVANGMDEFILAAEQAVTDAKNLRSGLLPELLSGEHEIPESYDKLLKVA